MNIQRLKDPHGLAPADINELSEKVSSALARMCRSHSSGGNPFIYCFAAVKSHIVDDIGTAATDGKRYYWGADFLRRLTPNETLVIICHETYHVILQHVARLKISPRDPNLWNIACDFWVNGLLKKEHNVQFGGSLGSPISLNDMLNGKISPEVNDKCCGCFVDDSLLNKTVEEIYDILDQNADSLKNWAEKYAKFAGIDLEGGDQLTLDEHLESKLENTHLSEEIRQAMESAKAMGIGKIPAEVEAMLGLLDNPQIPPSEWIKRMIFRKANLSGLVNDYRKPRRRPFMVYDKAGTPVSPLFMPRRRSHKMRWVALIDTSGSMSDADIAFGMKELKTLSTLGEGVVVPTDTTPHWEKATRIESVHDLQNTKIVGRGGTAFEVFFKELEAQSFAKEGIDFIVVITDGMFTLDIVKYPIDTVWVYTNKNSVNPPFGKRIDLF